MVTDSMKFWAVMYKLSLILHWAEETETMLMRRHVHVISSKSNSGACKNNDQQYNQLIFYFKAIVYSL